MVLTAVLPMSTLSLCAVGTSFTIFRANVNRVLRTSKIMGPKERWQTAPEALRHHSEWGWSGTVLQRANRFVQRITVGLDPCDIHEELHVLFRGSFFEPFVDPDRRGNLLFDTIAGIMEKGAQNVRGATDPDHLRLQQEIVAAKESKKPLIRHIKTLINIGKGAKERQDITLAEDAFIEAIAAAYEIEEGGRVLVLAEIAKELDQIGLGESSLQRVGRKLKDAPWAFSHPRYIQQAVLVIKTGCPSLFIKSG